MIRAVRLAAAAAGVAAAVGCGLPDPGPMVRVVAGAPSGPGADPAAAPSIRFTGPVAPDGLLDGRRFLLARELDLAAALAAVESEGGADAAVARVEGAVALDEGAMRVLLRPRAPLAAGEPFVLVLSSRARDADGRPVLDADGKHHPTVVRFETEAAPPPAVRLTEVLADAETPEAGGEYVEVLNLGPGTLDLAGWRLEKRSEAGGWSGCSLGAGSGGPAAAGAAVLVVGGSWDGRYALPPGVVRFPCGATSLAGGIANDRPPVLRLLDRRGAVAAELDAGGVPLCVGALEADVGPPEAGAVAACCRCTEGSPGWVP